MHWIFRQRDAWLDQPFFRLEVVRVEPEKVVNDNAYDLPLYVGDVLRAALQQGYLGSELPTDAEAFLDLWTYHGELRSNGHYGYSGNVGDIDARRRASDFLCRLGLPEYREILDEFISLDLECGETLSNTVEEHPDRLVDLIEPYHRLDDRFFELDGAPQRLPIVLRDWLSQQAWVVAETGAPNVYRERELAVPLHPLAERRREACRRLHRADNQAWMRRLLQTLLEKGGGGSEPPA